MFKAYEHTSKGFERIFKSSERTFKAYELRIRRQEKKKSPLNLADFSVFISKLFE